MTTYNSEDRKVGIAVISMIGLPTVLEGTVSTHRPFEHLSLEELKRSSFKGNMFKNENPTLNCIKNTVQFVKTVTTDHVYEPCKNSKVLKIVTGLQPKMVNNVLVWPKIGQMENVACHMLDEVLGRSYQPDKIKIVINLYGRKPYEITV